MNELYYKENGIEIWWGDCQQVMQNIIDIELVVTSPPYNLGGDFHTMVGGRRVNYGDYGICKDNMSEYESAL